MAGIKQRLGEARDKHPVLDHVLRMQEHYGSVKAGQQAGAVTYFAFLSFFPILALAVFVVGAVSNVYPEANANLRDAINSVLPALVGSGDGQISLEDVRGFSGVAGIVGLLGVVYSGLGWVSALRDALGVVFALPQRELPSFVVGKLRDLLTLVVIGVVLLVSVAVAGFVSGFSDTILDWVGLDTELDWAVRLLAVVLGLMANAVLFYAMFRLLAEPHTPPRSLWSGALLGAVGFEVLKQISAVLFKATAGQPAFQAFGIALILVVWINYFSRVILYAAAWAHTTAESRALRLSHPADPVQGPASPSLAASSDGGAPADDATAASRRSWVPPFAAGGAAALGAVALARRHRKDEES